MYTEDYIKSLTAFSKPRTVRREEEYTRVNIKEYRYSDGTTSIVLDDREEFEGYCKADVIRIVREELRKRNERD